MESINVEKTILSGDTLLTAIDKKRETRGLVHALEAAIEEKDVNHSLVLLLAGLETPDVAQWIVARIPKFLKLPEVTPEIRGFILERLPSELAQGAKFEIIDTVLENVESKSDYLQLLTQAFNQTGSIRHGWSLAKDLVIEGDIQAAVHILDKMETSGHKHAHIQQSHAEFLNILGQHERAMQISRQLSNDNPERVDYKRNYVRMLMAGSQTETLEKELVKIISDHPDDWMLASFLQRARISPPTLRKCFSLLAPPDASSDARYILYYAASALAVDNLDAARCALKFDIPDDIPYAKSFKKAVKYALDSNMNTSTRFICDPTQPYQVVKAGKNKPTVVVCLSNSGINFSFLSIGFIDRLLSEFDVNVIYLLETHKMLFHRGIAGLGSSEEQTLTEIERLHEELGSSKRLTMGASLGGYGAARYGHKGKVDAVLSFAGPTDIFEFTDAAIPKAIQVPQFLIMQQAKTALICEDCKLKPLIESSKTRHYQFYGELDANDTEQANNIAHLPNVTSIPVPEASDHFVFGYCVANGQFQKVLTELLL